MLNDIPPQTSSYPTILEEVYSFSDGFSSPFGDIYRQRYIKENFVDEWLVFGFDGYFSYFLVRKDGTKPAFTIWDHEIGYDPEGEFESIFELIESAFEKYIESNCELTFVIERLPEELRKMEAFKALRGFIEGGNSEVLNKLNNLPSEIRIEKVSEELELKAKLKELNANYHIK